jgi:hypothetical protein
MGGGKRHGCVCVWAQYWQSSYHHCRPTYGLAAGSRGYAGHSVGAAAGTLAPMHVGGAGRGAATSGCRQMPGN